MNTRSWRRINMIWFYPIVAVILFIGVFVFAALYSGGGAEVLSNMENADLTEVPASLEPTAD